MIFPEKRLLCTGKFFQRIRPALSLFCKTDLVNLNERTVKKKVLLWLKLNPTAKKNANFEVCWGRLSTDYAVLIQTVTRLLDHF